MICDAKTRLTMQNANMLIDLELFPEEYEYQMDVYKLTKELRKHRDPNKLWYCGDRLNVPIDKVDIWRQIIADSNVIPQDLVLLGEVRRVLDSRKWDVFYEQKMSKIKKYITENKTELLKSLNNKLFMDEFNKYCAGTELDWELESLNFFFTGHPLTEINKRLDTTPIENIIEGAQDTPFNINGKIIPRMKLYHVIGTVIDKDKTKGTVTIQCPDGVVTLKIYKDLFATLAYINSSVDEDGNKIIYEESFLEKGTHLSVVGIQRGSTFVPKTYKSTGRKAIMRIVVDEEGKLLRLEEKEG
jgi:DNA polymerase-3 subunit alpha